MRLDLPSYLKIHDSGNVMHTVLYSAEPTEIAAPIVTRPVPVSTAQGNEYLVDKTMKHSNRICVYQLLTVKKGAPTHAAE